MLATGPLVLVEDAGRPGLAAVGVGRSGAADRAAHRLGARLVGHPDDRASLEVLLGGLVVRARGRLTLAVTGAPAPTTLDGRPVAHATLVEVPDGGVVALGMPVRRPAHLPHRPRRHRRATGAGVTLGRHALGAGAAGSGGRRRAAGRGAG